MKILKESNDKFTYENGVLSILQKNINGLSEVVWLNRPTFNDCIESPLREWDGIAIVNNGSKENYKLHYFKTDSISQGVLIEETPFAYMSGWDGTYAKRMKVYELYDKR